MPHAHAFSLPLTTGDDRLRTSMGREIFAAAANLGEAAANIAERDDAATVTAPRR